MTVFTYDDKVWGVDYGMSFTDKNGQQQYGYEAIIEHLHPNISNWIWVFEESYQGDFYGIGIDENRYYYFISGSFGSCSGCDWLEGIDSIEGALEFLRHYKKVLIKKPNKDEMLKYLEGELLNAYWKEGINQLISKVDEQ